MYLWQRMLRRTLVLNKFYSTLSEVELHLFSFIIKVKDIPLTPVRA